MISKYAVLMLVALAVSTQQVHGWDDEAGRLPTRCEGMLAGEMLLDKEWRQILRVILL